MHLKRWLTALVGIPLLIVVIGFAPRWILHLLLLAAALTALLEFFKITAPQTAATVKSGAMVVVCAMFAVCHTRHFMLLPWVMLWAALLPMVIYLFMPGRPTPDWTNQIAHSLWGPVYIGLPLAMLVLIDLRPRGELWIFFLLSVVFIGDTAAYYIGKTFGKRRLHARISPGKTWAGALGGLLGSLIAGVLFLRTSQLEPVGLQAVILIACMAVAGQLGDLAESTLKRSHEVKDSGSILPGHGGLLDRIDALLFAVPILYIYLYL